MKEGPTLTRKDVISRRQDSPFKNDGPSKPQKILRNMFCNFNRVEESGTGTKSQKLEGEKNLMKAKDNTREGEDNEPGWKRSQVRQGG